MDASDRVRLHIRRGEDYSAYVEWVDDDGNPITGDPGAVTRLQARTRDGSLVLDMKSGNNPDTQSTAEVLGTSGLIRLTAPRNVTISLEPGVYQFDLATQHKDEDGQLFRAGQRRYVLSGDLVVLDTTTRM